MERNCLNCKYNRILPIREPCCDCFGFECWVAEGFDKYEKRKMVC